ncbi:MAG: YraN family protein [Synergistaceae bacterium]|nr:YraN family protein [Synergistaceae bacterium]
MTQAQELGRFAEDKAAEYILSIGWRIIARNIRNKYGELDIIALDKGKNELVIIEVRARTIGKIQSPADSIGYRKLRSLINSSRLYIEDSLNWLGFWRIDLIGITIQEKNHPDNWTLEHIRDITSGMNLL